LPAYLNTLLLRQVIDRYDKQKKEKGEEDKSLCCPSLNPPLANGARSRVARRLEDSIKERTTTP
jgi:hypothetical protein